ncbi:MAG: sugar-binding protein, partial [Brachybacterium tyrofermentans]
VEGNHGNHQQAAMFAVEAYLLAGRNDVFPEHFDEGLSPFSPKRLLRSGSDGTSATGPDAVAQGFEPAVASDVVYGTWDGTPSERHGKRWSAVRDDSVHAYRTQGWHTRPPSSNDPQQIPVAWFTLIDSRAPLAEPTSGDTAALRGATLPIDGGLPLGTTVEISSESFTALPGVPFEIEVAVGSPGSALPRAEVELELPEGWSVGRSRQVLGTIPAKQSRTATFTVTAPEGTAPDEHVLLRARVSSKKGEGFNVLPLRTAGPVEAGLADRPEIAQFLQWTRELGMQRLDALVPTRDSLGQGRAEDFELLVRNHSELVQDAEVVLELPEGFEADPQQVLVEAVPAGGEQRVTVRIENTDPSLPTANRAPDGVYPVTVTATADGISASRAQGLHLVPRLVAARTQGVEVDAQRDSGEYPGDPIDIGTLWEGQDVTPEDASGTTWVTYDDEALHVFVHVTDDTLGALLPPEDNKQRFRTDSIEIMIDPRGTSDHTATTFILGVLPGTAVDGQVGPPAAGRDHDNRQGPISETAPGVKVAAKVSDPYDGYVVETTIPLAELPDGVDPTRIGFNVVVYDSDTQDQTGQSRIGWSTFPGVQADPFRWGVLELPDLEAAEEDPVEPRVPDSAARSVESPASILQAAADGVGLGGFPVLPSDALRLDEAGIDGDRATVRVRTDQAGTLRAFVWDGEKAVGSLDALKIGRTRETLEVPLTGDAAEGASLWIAVSLETASGTAAGAVQRTGPDEHGAARVHPPHPGRACPPAAVGSGGLRLAA